MAVFPAALRSIPVQTVVRHRFVAAADGIRYLSRWNPRCFHHWSSTTHALQSGSGSFDGSSRPVERLQAWDKLTDQLVQAATLPFAVLTLPQVVSNFANITAGNPVALSILSWEGYTSGLLGNMLMCTHFASKGEKSAVNVQLLGIINNVLVLSQLGYVSVMPAPAYFAAMALAAAGICINLARVNGSIPAGSLQEPGTWKRWQLLAGVAGLTLVPQVLYNMLNPQTLSVVPAFGAFISLAVYFGSMLNYKEGREKAEPLVDSLPGWAATLLFALAPLPQLVKNFTDPSSLAGLSVFTLLLGILGNGLMVPRALLTRDPVWLAGVAWSCVALWATLLSMFIRVSPQTGLRALDPVMFTGTTVVLVAYLIWVGIADNKVKGNSAEAVKER